MGMVVCIGPIILDMACGLSRTSPGWVRYLDQVISNKMDEDPYVRETSFSKFKSVQRDDKIGLHGLHIGRSDTRTYILFYVPKGT